MSYTEGTSAEGVRAPLQVNDALHSQKGKEKKKKKKKKRKKEKKKEKKNQTHFSTS